MHSETHAEESSNTFSSRKGGAWFVGTILVIGLYFMSPMFVAKAIGLPSGSVPRWVRISFQRFYTPAGLLHQYWKPYREMLNRQERWLGL